MEFVKINVMEFVKEEPYKIYTKGTFEERFKVIDMQEGKRKCVKFQRTFHS